MTTNSYRYSVRMPRKFEVNVVPAESKVLGHFLAVTKTTSMRVISRDVALYLLDVDDDKVRDIDRATDGSAMGLTREEDSRRCDASVGGGLEGNAAYESGIECHN
ncbi:uncharacterized protein LOC130735264 [Lotus japonicus]|uniref:uncharacterized protein LOC130735264 n=1 Tax=Lotus japonicus TaxID=34305 RepID=UPI00258EBCE3|nr:uncharacterized protein LOC130735264 [Lotus japonicus]